MSAETFSESTFEVPPDVLLANRLVWHGLQAFINPTGYDTAQPRLEFTDLAQNYGTPIEVSIHPNGTFENSDRPWAYCRQRSIYPGYAATLITLARVQANLPAEAGSSAVPQVMLNLDAHSALGVLRRTDLDDNERRYLQKTQYFFWQNRSAIRQDVFDTGAQKNLLVARRPSAEELRMLHGEVFTHDTCVCELGVRGLYQAPRAPQRGLLRLLRPKR